MGNLRKDAKDLIIGNDGSDKEPDDFKTELDHAIKSEIITKSDGTLMITARTNSDKLGKKIDEKQMTAARKINDTELYDSAEEEKAAIKEKEAKKEEERRRKEKMAQTANEMNKKTKKENSAPHVEKPKEREN